MKGRIGKFGLLFIILALIATVSQTFADSSDDPQFSIIISSDSVENAHAAASSVGAAVTHELNIINAVSAIATESQLAVLAADERVTNLHSNATVRTANAIQTVQDNFSSESYSNNHGTTTWLTDWEEYNDDNNPSEGKIEITGGALFIRDDHRAIWRAVDLSDASNATLMFEYGRWSFDNDDDYVTVEINAGDGWVELARYGGYAYDWSRRFVTHDISHFASDYTQIRFSTSGALSRRDTFSIDNLAIQFNIADQVMEGEQAYRDNFDGTSYSSNNGSVAWASPWVEEGDYHDAYGGDVIIHSGNLLIKDDSVSIRRIADLSNATTATLSLSAKMVDLDIPEEFVKLEVSSDYGDSWDELTRFVGPADDDSHLLYSFDLDAYIGGEIMIRFSASDTFGQGSSGGDESSEHTYSNCGLCFLFGGDVEVDKVYIDFVELDFIADSTTADNETVPASQMANANVLHDTGITGEGVTVAIIDSGFLSDNALINNDLGLGRIKKQYDAIQDLVIADLLSGAVTSDDQNGHGTHIASIIANSGKDGENRAYGIAPNVDLAVYKAFSDEGRGTYADVIRALDEIIADKDELGIRVINMSFYSTPQSHYWEDPLNQAVMRAWEAGIVVVTGAGNSGPDPLSIGVPGNVPYVITVGAYTDNFTPFDVSDDYIPPFSAAGPTYNGFVKPEIVAPGAHILGLLGANSQILNSNPQLEQQNNLFPLSGTSMSSAVTSGVVALMLQADPNLTPDDVKCRLMDSANTLIDNTSNALAFSVFQQGTGVINAQAAVDSTATGCANQGMNISADLDGTEHYIGTASRNADGIYVIVDADGNETLSWDGSYSNTSGNYAWTGANYAWTGGNYAWTGGNYAWTGANYAWTGANYAWTGANYAWTGGNYAWTGANYAWTGGNYAWTGSTVDPDSAVSNISYIVNP